MTEPADPERALALSYAPPSSRAGLAALFALDDTLAQILRTTREPLVGQMRLTWWHAALCALDSAPPPAQPVLQALAAEVLPRGVSGTRLARMIDGWEALLEEPLTGNGLARHAIWRGAGLFEASAAALGTTSDHRMELFGRGWAYADLARKISDPLLAQLAQERAGRRLPLDFRYCSVTRDLRPLSALAWIERMDLSGGSLPGAPRRVVRLAWHRLTGR